MKGIVFTEFLDLVEAKFGAEILEEMLDAADLKSGGAYTAVGYYDHAEMLELLGILTKRTGVPLKDLAHCYGEYLFNSLAKRYPQFIDRCETAFDLLESIDQHIHVEVKKLYSDAEVPHMRCERESEHSMRMHYESARPFADLAYGLIIGAVKLYQESVKIDVVSQSNDSKAAEFLLTQLK